MRVTLWYRNNWQEKQWLIGANRLRLIPSSSQRRIKIHLEMNYSLMNRIGDELVMYWYRFELIKEDYVGLLSFEWTLMEWKCIFPYEQSRVMLRKSLNFIIYRFNCCSSLEFRHFIMNIKPGLAQYWNCYFLTVSDL